MRLEGAKTSLLVGGLALGHGRDTNFRRSDRSEWATHADWSRAAISTVLVVQVRHRRFPFFATHMYIVTRHRPTSSQHKKHGMMPAVQAAADACMRTRPESSVAASMRCMRATNQVEKLSIRAERRRQRRGGAERTTPRCCVRQATTVRARSNSSPDFGPIIFPFRSSHFFLFLSFAWLNYLIWLLSPIII